jgi:hypothetical protein
VDGPVKPGHDEFQDRLATPYFGDYWIIRFRG